MTPYDIFARFYDGLTNDIDYSKRVGYYQQLFTRFGADPRIVLDLACGTGSLSAGLASAGYEVIGVDRSSEMLSMAAQKAGPIGGGAIFICQDMCSLDLYGTVDAVICHLDGINHLACRSEVISAFKKVSLFLNDGGLFIFDLNTPYKIEKILGNNTFVYDYGNIYCVWQNRYTPKSRACRFDLTFFEKLGAAYMRSDEHFAEKAYTTRQITAWLSTAQLSLEAEYDDFSFDAPQQESSRIIYVARKRG